MKKTLVIWAAAVVLVLTLGGAYSASAQRAQTTCDQNRRVLLAVLATKNSEEISNGGSISTIHISRALVQQLKDEGFIQLPAGSALCPSGGGYIYYSNAAGQSVVCSEHK